MLLSTIVDSTQELNISLGDDSWLQTLSTGPGWYFIETNTPIEVLAKLPPPASNYHYNIPQKTAASLAMEKLGGMIFPENQSGYIVYSGEAKNLKARAREHVRGHNKTYCLCLEQYPILRQYKWIFHYSELKTALPPNKSKLLRIIGEQLWRAKYGWPVLCGR